MFHRLLLAALVAFGCAALAQDSPKPDIIVAADGTGDFRSVQAAVASIPKKNRERVVVLIKNGVYREKVRVDAGFVTLRGESRKGTRIEFPQLNDDFTRSPDDVGRAVINVNGDDFVLENLTAENTVGQIGPHAFTIYGKGDRTVILNCDVLSHGADTLSLWQGERGRYYHANCYFRGSVDFVCPRGWCYVTNCSFFEMKSTAAVWHDGSNDRDQKFVLRDCRFDGTNGWVLARHHLDAQFFFLDCTFSRTMADRAIKRVIYPLNGGAPSEEDIRKNAENDLRNRWGERNYFWNCRREGGDFAWHGNNLATMSGSLVPEQITAAWTFAGTWNPERGDRPVIREVKSVANRIEVVFSEPVSVKGGPRLRLLDGEWADLKAGSGSETLVFGKPGQTNSVPVYFNLNGGAIVASEAGVGVRLADVAWPASK